MLLWVVAHDGDHEERQEFRMLNVLDRVEDKFFAEEASVAPGGWCCWCWCCCSINFSIF